MARMGLRLTSKASSVIERSVTRTGTTRCRDQTNSVSGCSIGRISRVPGPGQRVVVLEGVGAGLDQRLERGQVGVDAEFHRRAVLVRVLEVVGGVDLGLDLDRLDRGTA